ncbi:LLM class flavin-dependent oxidoreductase [Candidatus Bathyarchaeota archaeon]|nr:LLM class flavin-dependent oxidoreductase [Candidatus Bathyarchaeota archaeon]
MNFGVGLPTCREGLYYKPHFASPSQIIEIAKVAEELGFYSVWGNDHFTAPKYVREIWKDPPNFYDPLITLSTLAILTNKVRLAIGVTVLPIRNPVILAKQAATLDVFSGGRFILAVGLGSYREEFEKLCPDIASVSRGILLDEGLQAIKELMTKPIASFNGRYVRFKDVELYPKPLQKPFPIYIGGYSENNLKRVAEFGEGWFPAGMKPEDVSDGISKIKEYASFINRDVSKIDIAPQYSISISNSHYEAINKYNSTALQLHVQTVRQNRRRYGREKDKFAARTLGMDKLEEGNLIGTPNEIIEKIDQLSKVGVTHIAALIFAATNVDEMLEGMKMFSREVMPSFD